MILNKLNKLNKLKMKKLLLIVTCMILYVTTAFCQQKTYFATSITTGETNTYTNKYIWSNYTPLNYMEVVLKNNVLLVDDKASSVYIMLDKTVDRTDNNGNVQLGWNAIDEGKRNCIVKFVRYSDNTLMLYILYENIAFGYTLRK